MKQIELTQGKYALVDDLDYEWLNQWKWHYDSSIGYACRGELINGKLNKIYMHRLIMKTLVGEFDLSVDHVNRIKLDNQRKNLRLATKQLNGLNRDKNKNNTSGYKGVQWNKQRNRWTAMVVINGKLKHLGFYRDKVKAVEARFTFDKSMEVSI